MSHDLVSPDQLREHAGQFGIQLSEETISDLVRAANDAPTPESLQSPPSTATATESATTESTLTASTVTRATDEANALLYRFDLDTGDGPLSSLQVGVKDNIAVAGVPMTCGSAAIESTDHESATVVQRLADAGADVAATTNMDEFALFTTGETSGYGPTENPRVAECVPGGSSSGSAAAVAAGSLDAALGSDTGGSVRIPAAFCGVVGLKPTYASVSRYGFADLAPSFDVIGPIADSVEAVANVFDAIAGPDSNDPTTCGPHDSRPASAGLDQDVTGFRLGLVAEALQNSQPQIRDRIESVGDTISDMSIPVETVSLPGFEQATTAHVATTGIEFAELLANDGRVLGSETGYPESLGELLGECLRSENLSERVRRQFVLNRALDDATDGRLYTAARTVRGSFIESVRTRFEEFDALLLPTTPMVAPEFGTVTEPEEVVETTAHTAPFSVSGNPALSIPVGTLDGKPVGLQIVTPWNDEAIAIALGDVITESIGS